MENEYIVYIRIDSDSRVIDVNSSAFITDTTEWIEIDSGYSDKYHHAQGHYFDKPIYTDDGIPRYAYIDNEVVERTEEEIDADRVEPIELPTQLDMIEAQVMYTAIMTDTLIEEV